MSQLERLEEERKSRKVRKNGSSGAASLSNFVAFHPTKEERMAIKNDDTDLAEVISFLLTFVQDGHKLSIGYRAENGSFFVMLRDGGETWDKAVCLSAWHQDPMIAIYAMRNALMGRYSTFPHVQMSLFSDVDW
jgi:hypothetical protein